MLHCDECGETLKQVEVVCYNLPDGTHICRGCCLIECEICGDIHSMSHKHKLEELDS